MLLFDAVGCGPCLLENAFRLDVFLNRGVTNTHSETHIPFLLWILGIL